MMDTTELPVEITKAIEKADRLNDRAVANEGYGSSDLGLVITKGNIRPLAEHIRTQLNQNPQPNTPFEEAHRVIKDLPPEVLALAGLSACLHSAALEQQSTTMFLELGKLVAAECWAAGLTTQNPKLAKRIEKAVRNKHSRVKYRTQAARSIARSQYQMKRWSTEQMVVVGNWLAEQVVSALPDVFEWVRNAQSYYQLTVKPEAIAKAEEILGETLIRQPVFMPILSEPPRWTDWNQSHPDPRIAYSSTLMRTHHNDVVAAVKAAIEDGSMREVLDGVSTLQSVPWRINKPILDVIRQCIENKIEVPGLPLPTDIPIKPHPKPWAEMTDLERTQWKIEASETRQANREAQCDRMLLSEDMQIAGRMAQEPRFWTPMNCDWRGRVYTQCHFGFQREDRVRALFQFADGEPIGEEGIKWLKVHVANCGDFDKCSKKPIEERIAWVDQYLPKLNFIALHPMSELSRQVWTKADKPFLFLAAILELSAALAAGPSYITTLPVSFDGSCSGLQHLAALTRDAETASLVNLVPDTKVNDVYSVVGEAVHFRVAQDEDPLAPKFLGYGVDRKLCKRGTMTYFYGSKKYGMASQQQSDLMDPLAKDVLRDKIPEHPFGTAGRGSREHPGKAARFISGHIYDAIEDTARLPAEAMKFLQTLAKTMAHEGKPVRWKTPTGMPWINRYHDLEMRTLRLWLHDRGVKVQIRSRVAVGHKAAINKEKSANSVAPNFVHALDAAHLLKTANAAALEGIQLATVHDSFGCLASRAVRLNEIIREQFVLMYETHDPLSEVLEQCKCDLTQQHHNRLPMLPQTGTLNLKEIKNARYAFA